MDGWMDVHIFTQISHFHLLTSGKRKSLPRGNSLHGQLAATGESQPGPGWGCLPLLIFALHEMN
jgi:hypothetical protein